MGGVTDFGDADLNELAFVELEHGVVLVPARADERGCLDAVLHPALVQPVCRRERDFVIGNLLARIHYSQSAESFIRQMTASVLQGYLTYENPPPLGPYRRPMPRVL